MDKDENINKERVCCKDCGRTPCCGDNICESLVETGEELKEEEELTNKQIRFALYRIASNAIHGRLGAGVRQPLPPCVVSDITDLYPEENHQCTGFREK